MKKKRVMYNWVGNRQACTAKAFIAVCVDKSDASRILSGKISRRKFFNEEVFSKVSAQFPTLFRNIRNHYEEHGRELTEENFSLLLYGRFMNMFDFDKARKCVIKTSEHPLETDNKKLRKAYVRAKKMWRKGAVWGKSSKNRK